MTPEQEQAHITRLVAENRHIFIEASAGSGKTTRLTALIAEIISQGKAKISEILCVTFTEKAASELKARIFSRLAADKNEYAANALRDFSTNAIGTIHGFCRAALNDDPTRPGQDSVEANADETELFDEAREFVYRNDWLKVDADALAAYLRELDFGRRNFMARERELDLELRRKCLYLFGAPETQMIPDIRELTDIRSANDFKAWTMTRITAKMRELADEKGLLTFAGMISGTADAICDNDFAQKLRVRFRYALIDEFQDTDALQWNIFRTLFLNTRNRLIVVGDPKQAIYKFRGADVFVYIGARDEMLAAGAFADQLPRNHRSTPEILSVLDSVFTTPEVTAVWQNAQITYTPPEHARASDTESGVELYLRKKYSTKSVEDFARLAADRICNVRRRHPDWSIAVIAFKHRALETCAKIFREAGLEFAYYRQKPDFKRVEFIHLKVFLQSFSLPEDEGFALASTTLFLKAEGDPAEYYRRLYEQISNGRILSFLQNLAQNLNIIHLLLAYENDRTIFHGWRVLMQKLLALCGESIFDLESLRAVLYRMEHEDTDDEHGGDMLRAPGAVTLITVASAKGLDWNAVFLADGYSDTRWQELAFFHNARGNAVVPADADIFDQQADKLMSVADEARITQLNTLYVALTRAKQQFITFITPPWRASEAGPASYFLMPWAESGAATVTDFDAAMERLESTRPAEPQNAPPAEIEHGTIPLRIRERTSFSRLVKAEFSDTNFIEDILPRGSGIGEILHGILEDFDFSDFRNAHQTADADFMKSLTAQLGNIRRDGEDITLRVAERIWNIVENCALAKLPLATGREISLAELPAENLWREMPFWSSATTHRVLREKKITETKESMHGFMDLVFTADEKDYYILDYKSNSLSSITPGNIDEYTREHYGLQAEIYAEALAAYLDANYPGEGRRVAGCYFLFLRYLKAGTNEGVHFMAGTNG
ncbi:MAG: UvrD-helicase domain-containing protein [Spirochaetes bacterium]|nr:UvrD-helicase domain-containing protein [Spirochaetota bacterium]